MLLLLCCAAVCGCMFLLKPFFFCFFLGGVNITTPTAATYAALLLLVAWYSLFGVGVWFVFHCTLQTPPLPPGGPHLAPPPAPAADYSAPSTPNLTFETEGGAFFGSASR